jgi:hypothetical protein
MFKIENVSDRGGVILRLSGRIDSEHLEELRRQIEHNRHRLVLDLAEVRLVNRDVVQFLAHCEAKGIEPGTARPTFESGFRERRADIGARTLNTQRIYRPHGLSSTLGASGADRNFFRSGSSGAKELEILRIVARLS